MSTRTLTYAAEYIFTGVPEHRIYMPSMPLVGTDGSIMAIGSGGALRFGTVSTTSIRH